MRSIKRIIKAIVRRYSWYRLKKRVRKMPPMTPEEQEEQRRSFAYGNVKLSNPEVTRKMVDKVADAMAARKRRDEATLKAWKNVMKGAESNEIPTPALLDDEDSDDQD